MSEFVIGINGGGTHTDLIAVRRDRHILARAEAGPANYHNVGISAVRETLHAAIADLIRRGGQPPGDLIAIGAGLAGLDRQPDHAQFEAIFGEICPGVPVALDNDAIVALIAGAGRPVGVVEICGTGSIGYGLNAAGERARCGGWGYHIDPGSGYMIGHHILLEIGRADDGVTGPTALTDRILTRLGLQSPSDLIGWMYAPERRVPDFAALAVEAVRASESDRPDVTAIGILVNAADALAQDAITIARRLRFTEPFPLVLSGTLLIRSTVLRERFIEAVQTVMPHAVPVVETPESPHDPMFGAALMALARVGEPWPDSMSLKLPPTRRITERRNRLTVDIATRPTLDLVRMMNIEDRRLAAQITPELPQIAALIDAAAARFITGGRLIMAGAGTSGRLAVLDAVECRPTFGVSSDQVIGLIAGGTSAVTGSIEGAEDSETGGRAAIVELKVGVADTVIGIAASGSTPYVQGVLREATERVALTGAIVNVPDSPVAALAQYPIVLPVGPEVIMGSTRLRAGTAQKLALNMLTTGIMVRAGRTFGNLMTDVQMSNAKLKGRARVIVSEATGLSETMAAALLDQCYGEIKTAIAAHLLSVAPDEARRRLALVNGDLNRLDWPLT
ncbi:MAG: N-acetylmuramic acid 6-phosphate etherase [Aggregatilineales bacterium]